VCSDGEELAGEILVSSSQQDDALPIRALMKKRLKTNNFTLLF